MHQNNSSSHFSTLDKIVSVWQDFFQGTSNQHADAIRALESGILNLIPQSNLYTVIYSYVDLSILHINEAAAGFFGSSVEEITREGARVIASCFEPDQLKVAANFATENAKLVGKGIIKDVLNTYACFCNWKIHSRNGQTHRVMFRIFPVMLNDKGFPLLGMYLIHDVQPFLREHVWWYRFQSDIPDFMCFHSDEKKVVHKDIISRREKAILRSLATGKSSRELGEEFSLSPYTIDNHRRRMLAKTGAVDTTALIHIAKLSGIL